jgi:hypothetical protein
MVVAIAVVLRAYKVLHSSVPSQKRWAPACGHDHTLDNAFDYLTSPLTTPVQE